MPTFGPAAYDDDNRGVSTGRLINCYRQGVPGVGRATFTLKSVMGTEALAETGDVFFYGAAEFGGDIYAAIGGNLYRIATSGTVTNIGSVSSGFATISSNNNYLTVAAGGSLFTVLGMVSSPTVEPFSGVGSVAYIDQRSIVTESNGRRWAWSDLADPTSWPALNFATAESTDDNILRGVALNGRVILFKKESREIWTPTNLAGAEAFTRVPGGVRNTGLKEKALLTKADELLFYVGNDNIARLTTDGLGEQKLSYPPVDTALAQGQPTECFFYEDEGQKHCIIRFEDRPAWVFDLATGEWHERAYGPDHDAWVIRGSVKANGAWYGLTNDGKVQQFTRSNADVDAILRRTAISETFYFPERLTVDLVEIFGRYGYADIGRNAEMWIRTSKDGGAQWGPEKWRPLGSQGSHNLRSTWRALGQFRELTIEANVSEPDEIPLWSDYRVEAA